MIWNNDDRATAKYQNNNGWTGKPFNATDAQQAMHTWNIYNDESHDYLDAWGKRLQGTM